MPSPVLPKPDSVSAGDVAEESAKASGDAGSTWRTALRLVRYAILVDPRAFLLTVSTALAGSLTEGVGLVLLLPLLAVAGMNFGGSSAASRLG